MNKRYYIYNMIDCQFKETFLIAAVIVRVVGHGQLNSKKGDAPYSI